MRMKDEEWAEQEQAKFAKKALARLGATEGHLDNQNGLSGSGESVVG